MDKFDTFHQCFLYKIVIPVPCNAFMAIITGRVCETFGAAQSPVQRCEVYAPHNRVTAHSIWTS